MELFKSFSKEKKEEVLAIAKEHRSQDRFIQGSWLKDRKGDMFRGCFFGCMTQTDNNTLEAACETLGIPAWIVYVSEKIFEGLPADQAVEFPVQLIESVPAGVDTEKIWKKWNIAVLSDQLRFVNIGGQQDTAIKQCVELFKGEITESAARSAAESAARFAAESAVWSAAGYAVWSAAESAAESARFAAESARFAARFAAESARSAAESAARSAAESAVWSAVWSTESAAGYAHYVWMRDTLIELLKSEQI